MTSLISSGKDTVKLNIRGKVFVVKQEHLLNLPNSRLSKLSKSSKEFDQANNEYYFDVNPAMFHNILDLYSTGELHIPSSVCTDQARHIFNFWEIDIRRIEKCCWGTLYKNDDSTTSKIMEKLFTPEKDGISKVEQNDEAPTNTTAEPKIFHWQEYARTMFENPGSSRLGKVI